MKTKWFEIEVGSKTYRTYDIKAESTKKAIELALKAVDEDWEISKEWKQGADIESCEPFYIDKHGVKIVGTSHMSSEEFGNYIKNNCK